MTHMPSPSSHRAVVAELDVPTARRTQLLNVTAAVERFVADSKITHGVCHLYVPHTTAAITINEAADPDVVSDMEGFLDRLVPQEHAFRHSEGNSDSHIKASLVGASVAVFIANGRLELGRWQGIFFCEFDGPRQRRLRVKLVPD
jgi:secondary thiamine-phosphate synthase enzyme